MALEDILTNNLSNVATFVSGHNDTYPAIDPLNADLSDKTVVITGASKGIGKVTAISFAKAGCGKIAIAARSSLDSLEQDIHKAAKAAGRADPTVIKMTVDIASEPDVQKFAAEIEQQFGAVDVLINMAGYLETWVPFAETDPSDWWKSWEINIKGTYLVSRYLTPVVLKSPTKTIINVSSYGAHLTTPGASAYQTNKFAICRLSEFMSNEHGNDGLIAIAIHPGGVKTELGMNMPEYMHELLTDSAELAADTLVWLAKERREWLKGRFFSVNWDVVEVEGKKKEIVDKDLLKFRMVV
ncbi:C-factor [Dactylella cylindrospora]|nr:C-factor [Dactylella cylindrospora]